MKFDRSLQKEILSVCIEAYPSYTKWADFKPEMVYEDDVKLSANIVYLAEQGLLTIRNRTSDDPYSFLDNMRATVLGIDFLQDDGGLSTILKIQTIRLHQETLMALEDIIKVANLPEDEKKGLLDKLKTLPEEGIKHVTNELLSKVIAAMPGAITIIQNYVHGS